MYGGFGIFAQGTQSTDGAPSQPFSDLFAVGSDADEAGLALTTMLALIGQVIPEGPVDPVVEDPAATPNA